MAIPVQEFIGLGGFGGGVKAAELEFLNLLHIESIWFRYYYRIKWQKIQKNLQKNLPSRRLDALRRLFFRVIPFLRLDILVIAECAVLLHNVESSAYALRRERMSNQGFLFFPIIAKSYLSTF